MALILVLIVGGAGALVLRFSHASGPTYTDFVSDMSCDGSTVPHAVAGYGYVGSYLCTLSLRSSGEWNIYSNQNVAFRVNVAANDITCANISYQGYINNKLLYDTGGSAYTPLHMGDGVTVAETGNIPWNGTCPKFK